MKYFQNNNPIRRIQDMEVFERPRERMQKQGSNSLSDEELLAILIGSGGKDNPVGKVAREVLALMDSHPNLDYDEIKKVPGLGPAKACLICAALEVGRRRLPQKRRQITTPGDVYPLIRHYADRPQEQFIVIALNGAHEVLSIYVTTVGIVNRTLVHPREVFAPAIELRSVGIIVAHNHPSNINGGTIIYSSEDLDVTKRLKQAGNILGISVLDHLIIGGDGFYSMLENGVL